MSDTMAQEEAMNMSNEQAVQILISMRNMMCDRYGCPISDAVFALDKAIEALSADRPSAADLSSVYSTAYKSGYEKGKVDRPQGEWIDAEIPLESGGSMPIQACNLCKTFYPLAYTGGGHRFCPNCGSKMRGEHDD